MLCCFCSKQKTAYDRRISYWISDVCSADLCQSVRVVANEFHANATQRRVLRRNADLDVRACRPWATDEQYDLLRRYLAARHPGGGMASMDEGDYADMVEQSPVTSFVIEYREPAAAGEGPADRKSTRLNSSN